MDTFEKLKGRVLRNIEVKDEEVIFTLDKGNRYKLYHSQDCCENVFVQKVIGNINDLIGAEILSAAEEVFSDRDPEDYENTDKYRDSFTWSIYTLATERGTVQIRFLGESNGYYSESIDWKVL